MTTLDFGGDANTRVEKHAYAIVLDFPKYQIFYFIYHVS